jgi:hypothetical protein
MKHPQFETDEMRSLQAGWIADEAIRKANGRNADYLAERRLAYWKTTLPMIVATAVVAGLVWLAMRLWLGISPTLGFATVAAVDALLAAMLYPRA